MTVKKITEDPKITDTIQIDFVTTDDSGNPINPYRVDAVIVYFIERDFTSDTYKGLDLDVNGVTTTMYYTDAIPVYSFGTADVPAWYSADTTNAFIQKNANDEDGNVLVGNFTATWKPKMAREGDYFVCYTWTPLPASPKESAFISFFVHGDTPATTAIPSHQTTPGKYENLLDAYLPEMYKLRLSELDATPDVLDRFHKAVAKGFTTTEDLANQLIDLMDANVCHEAFLPYLSNMFRLKLRSTDPTLWRRQIKTAVPVYKKKGTLEGLKQSLDAAGITFQKLTQYWQVVSKSTWQDGFVVEDPDVTEYKLSKLALLPIDPANFELYIRYHDTDEYVFVSSDYAQLTNTEGETTMTWIADGVPGSPIPLEINDVIRIVYKIKTVPDQSIENYIRTLPLADKRDEILVSNPKKNWNVRLIAPDDAMFNTVVGNRHPFHNPIVWGRVRTEFAYSENVYNMEEYNGSLRNSNNPCDIDGSFADPCSSCLGSVIAVDVEIEDLSNDRIVEAREIIKDNIPFHAQIDAVNFSGGMNEYVVPPTEDIEILIQFTMNQNLLIGQNDFTRAIPNGNDTSAMLKRNMISTSSTAVSATAGTAFNDEFVLFAPNIRFDTAGIDESANLLQILSGTNTGTYTVDTAGQNTMKINQSSPSSISYPLDTAAFTFNLSNEITSDLSANITQDDYYVFSESGQDFLALDLVRKIDSASPSKLVITTGVYAGAYDIYDSLPDNSLVVLGFPATANVTNLKYRITNNSQTTTLLNRSTTGAGKMSVTRRGLVDTIDLQNDWNVTNGYYIRYSGTDYLISGFKDADSAYIAGYTGGTVAGVSIKVYKRVIDQTTGYVDARGMYLTTTLDYEAALDVQNGANPPTTPVESSSFMENFLVLIGGNYYRITSWDGTRIDLTGPKSVWGLSGTSVSFQILQYDNVTPIDVVSQQADHALVRFQRIDRRGNEPVTYTNLSLSMYQAMMLGASALNNGTGGNEIIENVPTNEGISFTIEYSDGTTEEGNA
jgi:hypothetical protein